MAMHFKSSVYSASLSYQWGGALHSQHQGPEEQILIAETRTQKPSVVSTRRGNNAMDYFALAIGKLKRQHYSLEILDNF